MVSQPYAALPTRSESPRKLNRHTTGQSRTERPTARTSSPRYSLPHTHTFFPYRPRKRVGSHAFPGAGHDGLARFEPEAGKARKNAAPVRVYKQAC